MESHEGRRLRRGGRSRGRSGVRSHKSFAIVIPHSAFHEYEHFVNKEWSDPHLTKNLWIGRFRVLERAEPVLGIDWRSFLDNLCANEWIRVAGEDATYTYRQQSTLRK